MTNQSHSSILKRDGLVTLLLLIALLLFESLQLDLPIARWWGSAQGFAWQNHWFTEQVLHRGVRRVSQILILVFCLMIFWPAAGLQAITRRQRVQWLLASLLLLLLVPLLKRVSLTSCPWDLNEFGGLAHYVSHWAWGVTDGGPGGCFPAGHASAAFVWITGYFWLRHTAPRAAHCWLAGSLLIGLVLGLAQQMRGAHYMSHTLWTAWLCWAGAGFLYHLTQRGAWSRTWHPASLVALASLWLATVGNAALWRELIRLPQSSQSIGVLLGFVLMIACAIAILLTGLAWRWTLKLAVTLFLFVAAFGAYFMLTYGVVIDPTMMVNVLQTDVREVRDLLSIKLLLYILLLAVLPAAWFWAQKVRTLRWTQYVLSNVITFLLAGALLVAMFLLLFQNLAPLMRTHTQLRYLINPLNSFYALSVVAARPYGHDTSVIQPLGQDAQMAPATGKPPLVLLVLGETARSINFALNGYARNTTPELAKQTVVSQRNAWSCGTSTAASVPCMFSHLGREHFDASRSRDENLVDVLQHAGLAVLWLDNQSGCKGVCERVPQLITSELNVPDLRTDDGYFDAIMLHKLEQRIAELPAQRRAKGVVVFMHAMGSHGPAYYKRSPAALKKFLPECQSNDLATCERPAIVNAYDNSIVYADYFLSSAIKWLQSQSSRASTAMVYVSDHGESLGENNLYLHGLPYGIAPDVQKRVPWITWLSPAFEQRSGLNTTCLKSRLDQRISHDNYFSSVLGLLGVQTQVYQREMDIYAACASLKPH